MQPATGHVCTPRRVIKLGGSLLELEGLIERLNTWLSRQEPAENWLVVGGGRLADAIRHADRLHGLDERLAHWLCVRGMQINAHWVASLIPRAQVVASIGAADRVRQQAPLTECRLLVLDPYTFLRDEEPRLSREPLPEQWDVTSDSIAARLATLLAAEELVLLKSALPVGRTLAEWVLEGVVDDYFPSAVVGAPSCRAVNLRDPAFSEVSHRAPATSK